MINRMMLVLMTVFALAVFLLWRAQPDSVANQLVRDIHSGNYAAADSAFASNRGIALNGWSKVKNFRAKVQFEEQSWNDWFCGRKNGALYVTRTLGNRVVHNSIETVATATGVNVTSHCEACHDLPTPEETTAEWASAIGITLGYLTGAASNGR